MRTGEVLGDDGVKARAKEICSRKYRGGIDGWGV